MEKKTDGRDKERKVRVAFPLSLLRKTANSCASMGKVLHRQNTVVPVKCISARTTHLYRSVSSPASVSDTIDLELLDVLSARRCPAAGWEYKQFNER